jgi:dTDP-4-dehydrorhamnose reductase
MENKIMRILVTGYNGQLGYDVVRLGLDHGLDMIGTGSSDLDITHEQEVYEFVHQIKPNAIIHCAAYTAVDLAEDDKSKCWQINVEGTKYLAKAAKEVNAKLLYISTDYVFDGEGTQPFLESDKPNPKGYYGLTKFEGEKVVQAILEESFIVRISWVFGLNGNNFIKTMLQLSETRDHLNVVNDQVGSPTYTWDLAHLLIDMIQTNKYGIYHASNEGFCNWAEFSEEIFRQAGKSVHVKGVSTDEYPTRAVRPLNSRMSKQKLIDNGFDSLPNWQDAVARYLDEITQEVK